MSANPRRMNPFGVILESNSPQEDLRNLDVSELKEHVYREHLLVLRGFRTFEAAQDLIDYCEQWGEIAVWPFGKVLELIEQDNPQDHIFDHRYVPLHWDGMYRPQVPEFQIFHCVQAHPNKNEGRTTFSQTALALKKTDSHTRKLWSRVTGIYRRKMQFYDSKTIAPLITPHPTRGYPVIRYCEPPLEGDAAFVNHPDLQFEGLSKNEDAEFHRNLREALYHPENFYAHSWQPGDIVVSDNYTLLHGREAFASGSLRHLRRVHVLGTPPLQNPHLISHQ